MLVPVHVDGHDIEGQCEPVKEFGEVVVYCDDYEDDYEVRMDEVELDFTDIEDVVAEYLDVIVEILVADYRDVLLRVLENRKNEAIRK